MDIKARQGEINNAIEKRLCDICPQFTECPFNPDTGCKARKGVRGWLLSDLSSLGVMLVDKEARWPEFPSNSKGYQLTYTLEEGK